MGGIGTGQYNPSVLGQIDSGLGIYNELKNSGLFDWFNSQGETEES